MKIIIGLCLSLIASAAVAQSPPLCVDRADMLAQLATKYKEAPIAVGIANSGGLIEVLASEDGSTWTIILTVRKDGQTVSCLLSTGEEWHGVEPVTAGDGI